jgi:hypothetical protein
MMQRRCKEERVVDKAPQEEEGRDSLTLEVVFMAHIKSVPNDLVYAYMYINNS